MSIFNDCIKTMKDGAVITAADLSSQKLLSPAEKDKYAYSTVPLLVRENDTNGFADLWCKTVFYISDIHLFHHILMKYPDGATYKQIRDYIKEFVANMLTADFKKDGRSLLIGGDVSHSFRLSTIFYTELRAQIDVLEKIEDKWGHTRSISVFVVLGNHEMWDFKTLDECQATYKKMLQSLNITLLCNEEMFFSYRKPQKFVRWDKKNEQSIIEDIDPKKEPTLFEKDLITGRNIVIIGGTGFAEYNMNHNANNGFYRHVLNRQQEIEESEKWKTLYRCGLEKARSVRGVLIVLTHNPLQDWMGMDFEGDSNCIYFSGHNHNNFLYHNDDRNVHIFANNQIGYKRRNAKLKKAILYAKGNPFSGIADGIHEIDTYDYQEFYSYVGERLNGNGVVERMIKNNDCKFYMIKKSS